jgi:hypothetical protein
LRQLEDNLDAIHAAGADVLVLTYDAPEVITEAGFGVPIASVPTSLWAELGIANPDRPELPHPTTIILDASGRVLLQQSHVNYKQRTPIPEMLATLANPPAPMLPPMDGPDWESGVSLTASGADDCLSLTVQLTEGYHLYGAKETTARPLAVTVNEAPDWQPHIPDGTEKILPGLGSSWVLEGNHTFQWPLPDGLPRTLTGTIAYQLCTDTSCSPPAEQPLEVTRLEGHCSTPDQLE